MPSGPGDFERFKSPMASSNVCIEKAPPNKDHSPSCSGDRLWIPNYATACAVEDPPRKAKKSASFVKFSTSALGDGPRNFEPWSSEEDDKCRAGTLLS
ncbi:hypothetical protein TNCV_3844851 [Trichonephila clavipes]|nr:hypothetical protein TNCV_3844851 [Trichonephila clavipes]